MQGHNPVKSPPATSSGSDADKASTLAELQRHVTQRDVFPSIFQVMHSCARMDRIVQDGDAHRFVQSFSGLVNEAAHTRVGKGRPFALMVETGLVDLRVSVIDPEHPKGDPQSHALVTRSDSDINHWCTSLVEKLDQRWSNPPKSGFFMRTPGRGHGIQGLEANMMINCPLKCDIVFYPGPNYNPDMAGDVSATPWQYIIGVVIHKKVLRTARSIVVNYLANVSSLGHDSHQVWPPGADDMQLVERVLETRAVAMPPINGMVLADHPDLPAAKLCEDALAQLSTYSIDLLAKHTNMVPGRLTYNVEMSECADDMQLLARVLKTRAVAMPPLIRGAWKTMCASIPTTKVSDAEQLERLIGKKPLEVVQMPDGTWMSKDEYLKHNLAEDLTFSAEVNESGIHVSPDAPSSLVDMFSRTRSIPECLSKLGDDDPAMQAALTKFRKWCRDAPLRAKELLEKETVGARKKMAKSAGVTVDQIKLFLDCIKADIGKQGSELSRVHKAAQAVNPEDRPATFDECMQMMKDVGGYTSVAQGALGSGQLASFTRDGTDGNELLQKVMGGGGLRFEPKPPPPPSASPPPPSALPTRPVSSDRYAALKIVQTMFDLETFDMDAALSRQRSAASNPRFLVADALFEAARVYRLFSATYAKGQDAQTKLVVPATINVRSRNDVPHDTEMDIEVGVALCNTWPEVLTHVLEIFPELFPAAGELPEGLGPGAPSTYRACIHVDQLSNTGISMLAEAIDLAVLRMCVYQICQTLPIDMGDAYSVLENMDCYSTSSDLWTKLGTGVGLLRWYAPTTTKLRGCPPISMLRHLGLSHLKHGRHSPGPFIVRGLRRCSVERFHWFKTLDADFELCDCMITDPRYTELKAGLLSSPPPPGITNDELWATVETLVLSGDQKELFFLMQRAKHEQVLAKIKDGVKSLVPSNGSPYLAVLSAVFTIGKVMATWKDRVAQPSHDNQGYCILIVLSRIVEALKGVDETSRAIALQDIFWTPLAATCMFAPSWDNTISNLSVREVGGQHTYVFSIASNDYTTPRLFWWMLVQAGALTDSLGNGLPRCCVDILINGAKFGGSVSEPHAACGRMLVHFANYHSHNSLEWMMATMPEAEADAFLFGGCVSFISDALAVLGGDHNTTMSCEHHPIAAIGPNNSMRAHIIKLLEERSHSVKPHVDRWPPPPPPPPTGTKTLEECRADQAEMEAWAKSKGLSPPVTLCMPLGGGTSTVLEPGGGERTMAGGGSSSFTTRRPKWQECAAECMREFESYGTVPIESGMTFTSQGYEKRTTFANGNEAREAANKPASWQEQLRLANQAAEDVGKAVSRKLVDVPEGWAGTTEGIQQYRAVVAETRAMLEKVGEEHGCAMGRTQTHALDVHGRAGADAEALITRKEKQLAADENAQRVREAEQAKKQAALDETASRLAKALKYTPIQWEELVASGYDEELKKKLFERLAKVLAATKALADPSEWRKLADMRETWREHVSVAKREAKAAARCQSEHEHGVQHDGASAAEALYVDVEQSNAFEALDPSGSMDASPVYPSPTSAVSDASAGSTSPPTTKLTKGDKRTLKKKQREKEAKEQAELERVADVERRRVEHRARIAREREVEEAAVAKALAASVESAQKEKELRERREVAQAQHASISLGRGKGAGRGGRGGTHHDAFMLYRRASSDGREVVFDSRPPAAAPPPPPPPRRGDHITPSPAAMAAAFRGREVATANVVPLSALLAPSPSRGDAASTVATALQCVICMTNERTHLLFPCGHKCLCADCAKPHVIKNKCPLCRTAVQGITEVFE